MNVGLADTKEFTRRADTSADAPSAASSQQRHFVVDDFAQREITLGELGCALRLSYGTATQVR